MEKEKSKIQVRDRESGQVLFECDVAEFEKAGAFAASMEELGLDIEVHAPTLGETLSSSLGLTSEQIETYKQSLEEEMDSHEGSCCFTDENKVH